MNKRIILAKASAYGPQGRGQSGKQKIYEITVVDNVVTFSWGMAEKARRQTATFACGSRQSALSMAHEKKWAKVGDGYRVALEA